MRTNSSILPPGYAGGEDRLFRPSLFANVSVRHALACDEWNLRDWHHPDVHSLRQSVTPEGYLTPRDLNDRNQDYTMADAVLTACFLNTLGRYCDNVGMANFAPIVSAGGWEGTKQNHVCCTVEKRHNGKIIPRVYSCSVFKQASMRSSTLAVASAITVSEAP